MFLAPFLLVPLGSVLISSAAHAQTTAQSSQWGNCRFSFVPSKYSNWRAFVQYRQSDLAARIVRIEFNGDEALHMVEAWTTRDIPDGSRQYVNGSKLTITAGSRTDWITSPAYYGATYVSNLYPRYVNVKFTRTDGSVCTGEVVLPNRL